MNYQFQTENSSTLRGCVFIDSSNPELPNQVMNHSSHPFIKPSFPPLIDPKDLLIISKDNKPSRSPNAFIIYRKVFLKTTRDQGYFLPMTIVSSMASKSWDQESEEVRSHYKRLAKEAYKYRTEQFPKKIKRRRRKEPWKTNKIAFQQTFPDSTESSSSSPMLQSVKNETPIIFPDDFSQNPSPNLEQQFKEPSPFNFQELFQSPNLSNNSSIMPSPEITINDHPESLNDEITINATNGNSDNNPYTDSYNNDLGQFDMELYDQNLGNVWQQLLLNQINNNFIDFNEINEFNEINKAHEINEINHPDYNNYSDYNNDYNSCNNYDNYYASNLLYQEGLGISSAIGTAHL